MLAHNLPVVAAHAELEKLKEIQHNFFVASFPQKKTHFNGRKSSEHSRNNTLIMAWFGVVCQSTASM